MSEQSLPPAIPSSAAPAPIEHTLLIDAVFRRRFRLIGHRRVHPVQGVPMEPGLRVKNIGTKPFPGATATHFRICKHDSVSKHTLQYEEHMNLAPLNPGETTITWWPPGAAQMDGLVAVECNFEVPSGHQIWTYGRSFERDEKPVRYRVPNVASPPAHIEQQNAAEQRRTNRYMLLLAGLTFVQGVWGLDKVVFGSADAIGTVLASIARWFIALGGR